MGVLSYETQGALLFSPPSTPRAPRKFFLFSYLNIADRFPRDAHEQLVLARCSPLAAALAPMTDGLNVQRITPTPTVEEPICEELISLAKLGVLGGEKVGKNSESRG